MHIEEDTEIMFYNVDFEDYLFQAIQAARFLNTDDGDADEVYRYLGLAVAEVDLFRKRRGSIKKEGVCND